MSTLETPISQTQGWLQGGAAAFNAAVQIVTDWIQKKAKMPLPESELGRPALAFSPSVQIEVLRTPSLWAARYASLSRSCILWTAESFLKKEKNKCRFGMRLSALHDENKLVAYSLPPFAQTITKTLGLRDENRLLGGPAPVLKTEKEVDSWIAFIKDPARRRPIFIASLPVASGYPLINMPALVRQIGPLGFCVQLPHEMTYAFSKKMSPFWAVRDGAFRTFMPGFRPVTNERGDHPLARTETLIKNQTAIIQHCFFQALHCSVAPKRLPLVHSFDRICARAAAQKTQASPTF